MVHRLNTDLQATAVLVAALHMSAFGTKRTFPVVPIDVRFWG
jgi:hypothetical protein